MAYHSRRENEAFAYACPIAPQTPQTPDLTASPADTDANSPPPSLRQYSSALKAMMKRGMTNAMADMKDDSREAERSFDKEFGYADEDPIERHVKMFLTPPLKAAAAQRRGVSMHMSKGEASQRSIEVEEVLIEPTTMDEADEVDNPAPFRPGLIQFRRAHSSSAASASRRSLPSFGSSGESGDQTCSNLSTPFGSGSTPFGSASGTPGSAWSEDSFDAIKPEDALSLYGTADHSTVSALSALRVTGPSRVSTISTYSAVSTSSTATDSTVKAIRPSLARPRSRATPYTRDREDGRLLPPPIDEEEDWLSGRTVSERMIAQAGLSCQRGRANRQ